MKHAQKYIDMFKTECHDRGKKIDKDNEQDWLSLTYGWAIAKGMSIGKAYDFALYIRYHTDLG